MPVTINWSFIGLKEGFYGVFIEKGLGLLRAKKKETVHTAEALYQIGTEHGSVRSNYRKSMPDENYVSAVFTM